MIDKLVLCHLVKVIETPGYMSKWLVLYRLIGYISVVDILYSYSLMNSEVLWLIS